MKKKIANNTEKEKVTKLSNEAVNTDNDVRVFSNPQLIGGSILFLDQKILDNYMKCLWNM